MMKFKHLVLAGTFDHLHQGHQKFISQALSCSHRASLGITTDWVRKQKSFNQSLESYQLRYKALTEFLKINKFNNKTAIFPLTDSLGPSVNTSSFDAIAATQDTLTGVKKVNQKRHFYGLQPLKIMFVDLIMAQDKQNLSSTRIRAGNINRKGIAFRQLLSDHQNLYLPPNQRIHFQKPLGRLITGSGNNLAWTGQQIKRMLSKKTCPLMITVGDISTMCLSGYTNVNRLALVDQRTQRQPFAVDPHINLRKQVSFIYKIKNEPGTLNHRAINTIFKVITYQATTNLSGLIQVEGEEDLLVLPAILAAPLNTFVVYGQPNQGMVVAQVTEDLKEKVISLLKKFTY